MPKRARRKGPPRWTGPRDTAAMVEVLEAVEAWLRKNAPEFVAQAIAEDQECREEEEAERQKYLRKQPAALKRLAEIEKPSLAELEASLCRQLPPERDAALNRRFRAESIVRGVKDFSFYLDRPVGGLRYRFDIAYSALARWGNAEENRVEYPRIGTGTLDWFTGRPDDIDVTPIYKARAGKCSECGEEFLLWGIWHSECCSAKCRRKQRTAQQRERRNANRITEVECHHCGERFKPQRNTAKYCSTRCRVYANRKAKARTNGKA